MLALCYNDTHNTRVLSSNGKDLIDMSGLFKSAVSIGDDSIVDEGDDTLPDKDAAKGFYAKYEPKEILGRYVT